MNPHGITHTPLKRTCLPGSTIPASENGTQLYVQAIYLRVSLGFSLRSALSSHLRKVIPQEELHPLQGLPSAESGPAAAAVRVHPRELVQAALGQVVAVPFE